LPTQQQLGAAQQRQQVRAARDRVLAHLARHDPKSPSLEFVQQLARHQVRLAQVRLERILNHP
jgi:hypothetical protein